MNPIHWKSERGHRFNTKSRIDFFEWMNMKKYKRF